MSAGDGFGLNQGARNAAGRAKRAKDAVPPPLNPRFPYTFIPFDPRRFGILAVPVPKKK